MTFPARRLYSVPLPDGRVLDLGSRPLVMGILNVTPDSFAEASPRTDPLAAVEHAVRMEEEGADIIDVGGESTRPGADPLPAAEEAARVLPVLRLLRGRVRVPISIDTYKAEIAEAAIAEGAAIVNDVSGLLYEPALAGVVARTGAALVLMHTRGRSKAMYQEAGYDDVVGDVMRELGERLAGGNRRRRRARAGHRRPRDRVCQTCGRQLWCAGPAARAGDRAGTTRPGRAVPQVVHAGRVGNEAGARTRLGDGGGRDGRCPRGRPHRACACGR